MIPSAWTVRFELIEVVRTHGDHTPRAQVHVRHRPAFARIDERKRRRRTTDLPARGFERAPKPLRQAFAEPSRPAFALPRRAR